MDSNGLSDAEKRRLKAGKKIASPEAGEDVVITGIAGKFPNSENTAEFMENLLNKVNLCDDDERRWTHTHPEIPKLGGKLYNIEKFDGGFFGVPVAQIKSMDPMHRMVTEKCFEAILDAGIHPDELAGTNTGVFMGTCFSEVETEHCYADIKKQGYAVIGSNKSIQAQRISYFFKLKGPSYNSDTACSSSLYAFEAAYRAIRDGSCDRAIVAGSNITLNPIFTLQFARLGVLNPGTGCRPFDENSNGYTRSEAIAAIILQKSKEAKRIYAHVVHSKVNIDGYKEQGITYPSGQDQRNLLHDIYEECQIDPSIVGFVEAHGTGTKVGDPEELNAIDEIFCSGKTEPLLIGSIKGNIGHTEPVSGLCSMIKMIYGMDAGVIPPNIHYDNPKLSIEGLASKRLVVVTEKTPWPKTSSYGGVNCFGFGGANCHVLLKRHEKEKNIVYDNLPRIICFSGRTQEAITCFQDNLKKSPLDYEFVGMLHHVFKHNIENHSYRGYSLISTDGEIDRSSKNIGNINNKLLYMCIGNSNIYTNDVIEELQKIPIFKKSFETFNIILKRNQIDMEISTNTIALSSLRQVVLWLAIQLGIIDILKALDITPDFILGSGLGDFTAAYANQALTMEQTILSIYSLSCCFLNEKENVGRLEEILLKTLQNIIHNIPDRKLTSTITNQNSYMYASPEYFLFNILNPSILIEQNKRIEADAVIINIDSELVKSKHAINVIDFMKPKIGLQNILQAIGSLYEIGYQPNVQEIYPKIDWPVSRGTPMISPMIKWDHSQNYEIPMRTNGKDVDKLHRCVDYERATKVTVNFGDSMFYKGHVIDGRNLFPATGYLFEIWELYAEILGSQPYDLRICFENVKFHRATTFGKDGTIKFHLNIQLGGDFEVSDSNNTTIVTGRISHVPSGELTALEEIVDEEDCITLNENDIYKEMKLRGYNYRGSFKAIKEFKGSKALIEWTGNWITFMDNMLQVYICATDSRSLYVPTGIDRLVIDAKGHLEYVEALKGDQEVINLPVILHKSSQIIRSEFIELRGLFVNAISRKKQVGQPILETYKFIPNNTKLSLNESLRVNVQICLENKSLINVKVLELLDEESLHTTPFSEEIQTVLGNMPLIQPNMTILTNQELQLDTKGIVLKNTKKIVSETGYFIFIGSNLLKRENIVNEVFSNLADKGCIITLEDSAQSIPKDVTLLTKHIIDGQQLIMIAKQETNIQTTIIEVMSNDFEIWLPKIQNAMKSSNNIILYAQNKEFSGLLGFVNCLRRESGGEKVSAVLIQDPTAPAFNASDDFYKQQINKGFGINVYKNGEWGTYRHLLMSQSGLVENQHCYSNISMRGDLSTLKWMEGNLEKTSSDNIVQVYYSAVNFRDVMTATGRVSTEAVTKDRLKQECIHGFEFSGRNSKGVRVMGMTTGGAIASILEAEEFTWEIPDDWSLEDAAAIPVVYLTVIYALIFRSKVKRGQSILIHSGTGGIGLAAINTALHFGCNIFVTVGTEEKRAFLNKHYPQIKNSQIGNSRDTSFEQMIYKETNGRGVDMVLNSLAEEKLHASVRCLAKGGNFLEIGKFDLSNNNSLYLDLIDKGCTFHGIMLDRLRPSDKKQYHSLLLQAMKDGYVKRLPKTIFEMHQLEDAFRYMSTGKHIGKVIIKIRNEEPEKILITSKTLFKGIPRFFANPLMTYVIIGGLGGFGLELADWMIVRGAKNVILSSRNGVKSGYQAMRINIWRSYGVKILVSIDDVTTYEGCKKIISEANKLAPIHGVFNLGVVLKDNLIENQTVADYKISFAPKAIATKYLDEITRKECPNLEYFVVFSSVSCGRGNIGQTNYGMSNSIMERICEKRKIDKLPGLAIQWGAVGDVGLVAEMQKEATEIAIGGTLQQRMSSCLEMMDIFLRQDEPVVASMVVAEKSGMGGAENLVHAVMGIMGMRSLKSISQHSTLAELGMDSMMGVEIKQTLEREYDVFLSAQDMRGLTFDRLTEISDQKESNINMQTPSEEDAFIEMFQSIYNEATFKLPIVEMNCENKSNLKNIVLFPGIESTCNRISKLSENIKYKSISTQYMTSEDICTHFGNGKDIDEIDYITNSLYLLLKNSINEKKEFYFVAHSFGSLIALEIASRLEKKGIFGKIAIIDGSYDLIQEILKATHMENDKSEIDIICTLLNFHMPFDNVAIIREKLIAVENHKERQQVIEANIPSDLEVSKDILLYICCNIYNLILSLHSYKPNYDKIKSKVILYKPSIPTIKDMPEDLNLSAYCEDVAIKEFEGSHTTIIDNPEMATDLDQFFG